MAGRLFMLFLELHNHPSNKVKDLKVELLGIHHTFMYIQFQPTNQSFDYNAVDLFQAKFQFRNV